MTDAEWIARRRADRIARRVCIQCAEPVAVRADGSPARMCDRHLDDDAGRAIAARARQSAGARA